MESATSNDGRTRTPGVAASGSVESEYQNTGSDPTHTLAKRAGSAKQNAEQARGGTEQADSEGQQQGGKDGFHRRSVPYSCFWISSR